MLGYFFKLINYIGYSNAFAITSLVIGVTVSYYLYFKTFYRLVYSKSKICKDCTSIEDWKNKDTVYFTRVVFYNNGRKTLKDSDVDFLNILSSGEIIEFKKIQEIEGLKIYKKPQELKLKFKYLDSKKYIIIELKHKGDLTINGRTEIGEILNTEPRAWLVANVAITIFCGFLIISNVWFLLKPNFYEPTHLIKLFVNFPLNIFLISLIVLCTRYLHSLFFIPDSVITKYLKVKDDKWNSFKNKHSK